MVSPMFELGLVNLVAGVRWAAHTQQSAYSYFVYLG